MYRAKLAKNKEKEEERDFAVERGDDRQQLICFLNSYVCVAYCRYMQNVIRCYVLRVIKVLLKLVGEDSVRLSEASLVCLGLVDYVCAGWTLLFSLYQMPLYISTFLFSTTVTVNSHRFNFEGETSDKSRTFWYAKYAYSLFINWFLDRKCMKWLKKKYLELISKWIYINKDACQR
jgi:hypothetical protein